MLNNSELKIVGDTQQVRKILNDINTVQEYYQKLTDTSK